MTIYGYSHSIGAVGFFLQTSPRNVNPERDISFKMATIAGIRIGSLADHHVSRDALIAAAHRLRPHTHLSTLTRRYFTLRLRLAHDDPYRRPHRYRRSSPPSQRAPFAVLPFYLSTGILETRRSWRPLVWGHSPGRSIFEAGFYCAKQCRRVHQEVIRPVFNR